MLYARSASSNPGTPASGSSARARAVSTEELVAAGALGSGGGGSLGGGGSSTGGSFFGSGSQSKKGQEAGGNDEHHEVEFHEADEPEDMSMMELHQLMADEPELCIEMVKVFEKQVKREKDKQRRFKQSAGGRSSSSNAGKSGGDGGEPLLEIDLDLTALSEALEELEVHIDEAHVRISISNKAANERMEGQPEGTRLHSFTHSLTHSLTHSFIHSLALDACVFIYECSWWRSTPSSSRWWATVP